MKTVTASIVFEGIYMQALVVLDETLSGSRDVYTGRLAVECLKDMLRAAERHDSLLPQQIDSPP